MKLKLTIQPTPTLDGRLVFPCMMDNMIAQMHPINLASPPPGMVVHLKDDYKWQVVRMAEHH